MTFLGIPNTAHFANVTEIEDALALWAKLKEQKAHERQSCEIVISRVTHLKNIKMPKAPTRLAHKSLLSDHGKSLLIGELQTGHFISL